MTDETLTDDQIAAILLAHGITEEPSAARIDAERWLSEISEAQGRLIRENRRLREENTYLREAFEALGRDYSAEDIAEETAAELRFRVKVLTDTLMKIYLVDHNKDENATDEED